MSQEKPPGAPPRRKSSQEPKGGAQARPTPLCMGCRHLYTTWKPARPRGCHYFGFESRGWPCDSVKKSSGTPCGAREARPNGPGTQSGPPSETSGSGARPRKLYG